MPFFHFKKRNCKNCSRNSCKNQENTSAIETIGCKRLVREGISFPFFLFAMLLRVWFFSCYLLSLFLVKIGQSAPFVFSFGSTWLMESARVTPITPFPKFFSLLVIAINIGVFFSVICSIPFCCWGKSWKGQGTLIFPVFIDCTCMIFLHLPMHELT